VCSRKPVVATIREQHEIGADVTRPVVHYRTFGLILEEVVDRRNGTLVFGNDCDGGICDRFGYTDCGGHHDSRRQVGSQQQTEPVMEHGQLSS
jgi:hypothetical protein